MGITDAQINSAANLPVKLSAKGFRILVFL
jgi:hypothetical protein